ncbi:MAG: recombinase family protein, partial [Peptococcaceae bacterium]|nr:recombinase family protein [Peptococcaceae bacterium]
MAIVGLYARVSSDAQEKEQTVQSQLEELRAHVQAKEYQLAGEFIDEGYTGATFARPALDRLRDAAAKGDVELVLVHSPDRLARKAAYQAILIEEFQKAGVLVEFLNHPLDDSPEGQLLLTMQGGVAEYERAKISERTRRGKQYWARQGAILGGNVPYGYRRIPRDSEKRSALEIYEPEAAVVRQMYDWLVKEQISCRAIVARLQANGTPTKNGTSTWHTSTVHHILRQEVYAGTYYYNKNEQVEPLDKTKRDSYRKNPKTSMRPKPKEEWIPTTVPAIIDRETWEKAQLQLQENSRLSLRNNKCHEYLLRGLIRCGDCGRAYAGSTSHGKRIYRCPRYDHILAGDKPTCHGPTVKADEAESVVWEAVSDLLRNPEVLHKEYERRLAENGTPGATDEEQRRMDAEVRKLKKQEDRLLDAYQAGMIEMDVLKERMGTIKAQKKALEDRRQALENQQRQNLRIQDALAALENFREEVGGSLDSLDFQGRQKVLRTVLDQVVVDGNSLQIKAIIPPEVGPGNGHSNGILRPLHQSTLEGTERAGESQRVPFVAGADGKRRNDCPAT